MLTPAVQMEQNKTKYDCMPRLIFNRSYGSNFLTILDFFIGDEKTRRCREAIRDLTKPRRRRQRERQKTTGLMSKTTTLHAHHAYLYTSLPSLHNYDVKWPNFKFTWERERQGDKFYHLRPNLSALPSLRLQPKFPSFKQQGELG